MLHILSFVFLIFSLYQVMHYMKVCCKFYGSVNENEKSVLSWKLEGLYIIHSTIMLLKKEKKENTLLHRYFILMQSNI